MKYLGVLLLLAARCFGATYYVRTGGNDSCDGTVPVLGTSGACAWKTVGHAISSHSSGDTVYVGGGTYREAGLNIASNMNLLGDPLGGWTGDQGVVTVTGYTTSDTSAPSSSTLLTVTGTTATTVSDLYLIGTGSSGSTTLNLIYNPTGRTLRRVIFSSNVNSLQGVFGQFSTGSLNILFDRCVFAGGVPCIRFNPLEESVDYSLGITIQNSMWMGTSADLLEVVSLTNGANTGLGGGVLVYNSTFEQVVDANGINVSAVSGTFPVTIYNSYFHLIKSGGDAMIANIAGQISEDYNFLDSNIPYVNVTQGPHSVINPNMSPRVDNGLALLFPAVYRCQAMFSLLAVSPMVGYGNHAGGPTVDITGKTRPNPASVGALEAASGCPQGSRW